MRPGYLYFSIFTWLVFTGGRFTAPFLQTVAGFDDSLIGITISVEILLGSFLGSMGAVYSDKLEMKYPHRGRIAMLASSLVLSTICFEIHAIVNYFFQANIGSSSDISLPSTSSPESTSAASSTGYLHDNVATGLHISARMLYASFSSVIFPILDGITLASLKSHHSTNSGSNDNGDNSLSYGKERLFGAVAWAVSSVALGPILDAVGYHIFFWSAPLGCILCLIVFVKYVADSLVYEAVNICEEDVGENDDDLGQNHDNILVAETEMVERIRKEANVDATETTTTAATADAHETMRANPKQLKQDIELDETNSNSTSNSTGMISPPETTTSMSLLRSLLATFTACGFILSSLTLHMGMSVVEVLIFLYLESLGGSNAICGLSVVVTVVFEIPIFHYAPKLLASFGAENLQKIACFAYITRVVGYTFIPEHHAAWVLIFEPLHGVTYACAKTSEVEFAARITPMGFEASGQGLLSMLLRMGTVLGLALGGWIEGRWGAVVLYRLYSSIVAVGLGIFYLTISADSSDSTLGVQMRRICQCGWRSVGGDNARPKYSHVSLTTKRDISSPVQALGNEHQQTV